MPLSRTGNSAKRSPSDGAAPWAPGAMRVSAEPSHSIYAVGDIHGRADLLDRLLVQIERDAQSSHGTRSLVFVGDYIDRGPDSRAVIDRLLMPPEGFEMHYLRGNHDQALLDFLEDYSTYPRWRSFGADETLLSYGVMPPAGDDDNALADARDALAARLPEAHYDFLRMLKLFVQIGDYHFVHAGVRPGIALEDQSEDDMMWIRDAFLTSGEDFGKIVVHGHTPVERPECRRNRIGIDTGAFASNRLTAVVLDGIGARFLNT